MTMNESASGSLGVDLVTQDSGSACSSCGASLSASEHFCSQCGKVQPDSGLDYFSFFGLPRRLNLDLALLERKFYRLSRKLHPDRYAGAGAEEQQRSLEKSSRLNDAYRILKDPIARTKYLLEVEGVKLEEQSRAATDLARQSGQEKKQVVPPDLLEEAFELNMQLEEMRMAGKMGEPDPSLESDLQSARKQFEQKLEGTNLELQRLWKEWDQVVEQPGIQRDQVRDQMVALLNRRSYIRNLVRDVNEVLAA